MSLRIQRCASPRQLMVAGELDVATVHELQLILGTISSTGDIVLDVEFLRFIDDAGLRILIETAERLEGSLVLLSPPDVLVRLTNLYGTPKNLVLRADDDASTATKPDSARA